MANVPIVTEVTKLQLDALVAANGLNEGLQYKVTDKDWLLIATSNSLLKPLYETLVLSDDIIPDYIITNNVVFVKLIDFSVVSSFALPIFDNYFIKRFEINVLNDEEITGMLIAGTEAVSIAGKKIFNILDVAVSPNSNYTIASATDQSAYPFKIAYHYQKMYSI